MRRQPSGLMAACAAVMTAALVVAGCEAKVYGTTPGAPAGPQLTVVAPQGSLAPLPEAPPDEPAATFEGLEGRARQATADAAKAGADISAVVLDRNTGQIVSNGNGMTIAVASVAKLFIADDLLLQESKGQTKLSPADRSALDVMLRSSDDNAAERFWNRSGGGAIINRVAARYGLASTTSARQRAVVQHHQHRGRPSALLRHAAGGHRRVAARAGQHHHRQPGPVHPDAVSTDIRSDSASRTGCSPNRSRSSRAGCAASVPTGCTCPPVSSARTAAT